MVKLKLYLVESDLAGIDELVFNPVTGNPGDEYDKGADGGKIKNKITWKGHDNHLHIVTNSRKVMIELIDKAHSMGLKTTENPYAKKDPNGKVDNVHSAGSFHYKVFQGAPAVGAGVDISGNKSKVREFIRWVNSNYRNKKISPDPLVPSTAGGTSTGGATTSHTDTDQTSDDAKAIVSSMISAGLGGLENLPKMVGLKEEINRIKTLLK